MKGDELLFELRGPDGHVWRLYLDGRTEGFPEGTAIENRAHPSWCALIGESRGSLQIGAPGSAFRETEEERKNRLSDQLIAESRARLMPDKEVAVDTEAKTPEGLDCAAIKQLIENEPLFILHMPDGSKIQLFASGPEGITGTGIRFESRIWQLLLLLPGEVIP